MFKNKRDYTRFNASLGPVHCEKSGNQNINITIRDVSLSGAGILTDEILREGDTVNLELRIPKDDIPLFVTGEVAWVLRHKEAQRSYNAGLRWVRLNHEDKNRLISYLDTFFHI